jgi:S1-C subfamily serine protease
MQARKARLRLGWSGGGAGPPSMVGDARDGTSEHEVAQGFMLPTSPSLGQLVGSGQPSSTRIAAAASRSCVRQGQRLACPAVNAAVSLIGRVLPATVHVRTEIPSEHPSARLLGTERMGSGTIIDPSGLILTVSYVVLGASEVRVTMLDQREYVAEVVRYDFTSGLGLVRIAEGGLPSLPLQRTTDLHLGDEVFLVASAGEGSARISNGGVSYLGPFDANWEYVLERAVMTTAMNPGLGGGPLLDMQGRVLGVVSLNLNEIGRFSLVIPSEYYLDARDQFLAGGGRGMGTRAWLGVFCYAMNHHVVIAGVLPGGPGESAGLKAGDVVLAVDGRDVADRASLYRHLWRRRPGEPVTLKVFRSNEARLVTVASGDVVEFFA